MQSTTFYPLFFGTRSALGLHPLRATKPLPSTLPQVFLGARPIVSQEPCDHTTDLHSLVPVSSILSVRPHTGDPTHRTTPVWLSDLSLLCARVHRSWQLGSPDTHHWIRLGSSSRRHIHFPGRTPSLGSMGKEGVVSPPLFRLSPRSPFNLAGCPFVAPLLA